MTPPFAAILVQPLAERIGWVLVHFLWQGAVVAILAAAALLAARKRRAETRYAISCLALLAMTACPAITFLASGDAAPAAADAVSGEAPASAGAAAPTGSDLDNNVRDEPLAVAVHPAASLVAALKEKLRPALPWAVLAWLSGVLVCSILLVLGSARVRALKRRACRPVEWIGSIHLDVLIERLHVRRAVRFLESALVEVPTLVGWLRPIVLLPASALVGLTPEQLEVLVAHELAHVRRHDFLVNTLQAIIETLLFYHPAVWWISRRIRLERERCCDDLAVEACGDRVLYARALAAMEELRAEGWGFSIAASGASLEGRIRRILGLQPLGDARSRAASAAIALCIALAGAVGGLAASRGETDRVSTVETASIRVVEAATGSPLAGAKAVLNDDADPARRDLAAGVTDSAGTCQLRIPSPPPARPAVTVHSSGFVPWKANITGVEARTVRLTRGATVGGVVVDDAGVPIPGATIVLRHLGEGTAPERASLGERVVTTDARGAWSWDALPERLQGHVLVQARHPDHVPRDDVSAQDLSIEDLQAFLHSIQMPRGGVVTGAVHGVGGEPIEAARVRIGKMGGSMRDATTSDVTGHFRIGSAEPGENYVLLQAAGRAPDMRRVVVTSTPTEIDVRLEPGRTMQGTVVDVDGRPIPGAMVYPDRWRGQISLGLAELRTDESGRFRWNEAPADVVLVDVVKEGFMSIRNRALFASASEHALVLGLPLRVRGKVLDARTREPIREGRALHGMVLEGLSLTWCDHSVRPFKDGQCDYAIDMPFSNWGDRIYPLRAYRVKVEADGYKSAVSRELDESEGDQAMDFLLESEDVIELTGVVRGPDGMAVAGAEVYRHTGAEQLALVDGKVSAPSSEAARTDGVGRFTFPRGAAPRGIVVVHDAGWFAGPFEDMAASSIEIALRPWGRIEGTLRVAGEPRGGERVSAWPSDFPVRADALLRAGDCGAVTDAKGRFVFARCLPGHYGVARWVAGPGDTKCFLGVRPIFRAEAGERVEIDLDGTGALVAGRFDVPESLGPALEWGAPSLNVMRSPEPGAVPVYFSSGSIDASGAFHISGLPPGAYELRLKVQEAGSTYLPRIRDVIAGAVHKFEVPSRPSASIDLGVIHVEAVRRLKVGDAAPPLAVTTLEGRDVRLEDFRGKRVLLHFWASWCAPCARQAEYLRAVRRAHEKDERLVILGLNLDSEPDTARAAASREGLAWPQGLLGEWSRSQVAADYALRGIPSVMLVGPDGTIEAKNLYADEIGWAVALALNGHARE